jgi:hypothetical protein
MTLNPKRYDLCEKIAQYSHHKYNYKFEKATMYVSCTQAAGSKKKEEG